MNVPERGAVNILAISIMVLASVFMFGIARLGRAASHSARADTAADAAALAAAGALATNSDSNAARIAADQIARQNGALLIECRCSGVVARVTVALGDARSVAKAEVRFSCLFDGDGC